ncbi:MAG: hypothetical protein IJ272_05010 [Clostridia bacterium]|nr:hypothetical protein [Clostridia bacterium]
MKEDLIKVLVEKFKTATEKYSNELEGVVNYKCEEFFRKNNPEKGYHSIDANIIFKNFVLKLEYKINISALIPKSTIEMRFMLENGKLPVEFSIYDLLNIMDENNFKCYTFGYVTSESKLEQVLKYLVDTFKQYKAQIEEISENSDKIATLERDVEDKIKIFLNEDIFKSRDAFYLMHMLELYYVIDVSRFTMDSYIDYTTGKYKRAIKRYGKLKDKLTSYEKRLVEYIKTTEVQKPVEDNMNTLVEAKNLKNIKTELLPMYLSWIILTPMWCIIYYLVYYIALYFLSKNAIYITGSWAYAIFLPAFMTAIINSYFTRNTTYKLLFKKKYNEIKALDEIENGGKIESVMSKLFQFIIAIGLVFSILAANTNISFYDEYFKNNLEFLNIKGTSYNYQDVECVYKADGIINDFGQVVNNPTYVIILKGGEKINLYYDVEFEDIKENIIPIFEGHNIEIREIDLVDNIQNDINNRQESQEN